MYDLLNNDVELAKEAVKKGLLSEQQLNEALKQKEQEGAVRSVITIMIDKKVLSNKAVKEIIETLKRKSMDEQDESYEEIEFGEEAAKKGYLTYTQLWEAIENRLKTSSRIEELLHKGGTLSLDDALDVLQSQGKRIMKCPECSKQYTVKDYRDGKEYTCLKCGAPLELPDRVDTLSTEGTAYDTKTHIQKIDEMFVGRKVGSCEIMEKLGEGGMGVVFKARHITLNKDVALKILSPALMGETHKKRFLREARAAAKLEHPNIVTVYDAGEFEGYNYIIMQYIDGESIGDMLTKAGKVDQLKAVRIIKDAAKALSVAHKAGMIHRDIKPDNIMLTRKGEVKVADFGLVKSADVEKDLSLSKSLLMGTPHYMAPEQFEGKPPDPRVDIYSLGVTFFELVTGKKPFDGKTAFKIMEAHLRQEPPKPETLAKEISPTVSRIILKMLAKEPDKRYQTVDELIKDLERAEAVLTGAKPPTEVKRIPVHLLVIVLVAIVGALVGYFVYDHYRKKAEEERQWQMLVKEAGDELNRLIPLVENDVKRNRYDEALKKLLSYPQKFYKTPSYDTIRQKKGAVIKAFRDYLKEQTESIERHTKELPEETVTAVEPLLRMTEAVLEAVKKDAKIEGYKRHLESVYKDAKAVVKNAKNAYKSIEEQVANLRNSGDYERAVELVKPFIQSRVRSVRESASAEIKDLETLIADAERDFKTALASARSFAALSDYDSAIKELEKYTKSKITSVREQAEKEVLGFRQQKEAKEREISLRRRFAKEMEKVDRLFRGNKREEAADLCKKLMATPLPDLADRAKRKLFSLKEKMYDGMVYIPAGSFIMGSDDSADKNPLRKVELKGFFIDRYEVTNGEYADFIRATKRKPPAYWKGAKPPEGTENLPVTGITYEDAKAYATWCGKRLPTEEEWEKAAGWDERNGVKLRFPWGNRFVSGNANIGDTAGLAKVGTFMRDKSPYGVYDLAGNASEFTSTIRNGRVVVRGGSYSDITTRRMRTSYAGIEVLPTQKFMNVGFRCVKDDKW